MVIVIKGAIFLAGIIVGLALMRYNYQLVHFFGHADLAERYLGNGGSYNMWRLLGLLVIVGVVWYVF
ncbi:hypothetical protein A3A71_01575 [Candidatus Berkelbacteria bacterium RIFCSPLOWO2_01_FULL_50_28]|uniref:Uncharacterized protein n=1 Tax=Candidatus Berkelbacteria bacterium RIFCSPLOWO2_01_FULL_50_28 TaxID=1797471 RepID=A0A1F5EBF7_9BACT|nr:MAG: hypothetical protein A3F39_03020 [Candidatus Berkelbacteria bacterium RIFCSPHIGHO2_12_FULL_50_11]OGD64725.1 MAG: hypothetical protein A3A71_01575 [Candidatus Berkelbacteria bacterium RIFCSPLOWO2_01_FULL_50_28]